MEKKVFLALALLILFVLGAGFALGSKVWISGADTASKPYNYTRAAGGTGGDVSTASRVQVLGFKIWTNNESDMLKTLNITVYNIHGFNTSVLETVTTINHASSASGVVVGYDSDNNGVPDAVVPLTSVGSWQTVGSANYIRFNFAGTAPYLPGSQPANNNYFILFNLSQGSSPVNTAYFNVTLETMDSPLTTTSNSSAGAILNATIGSANLTIDDAVPTISVSQTKDSDKNGYLDSLIVNFAENIDDTFLNSTGCFRVNTTTGGEVGDVAVSTGETGNDTILYINWTTNQIQYTNTTPLFNYTQNTSCQIKDIAGNILASNRDAHTTDAAPPAFWGCNAYDADREGKLDTINCTMSENLSSGGGVLGTIKNSLFSIYVNYGANTDNRALTIANVNTRQTGKDLNNLTINLTEAVYGTGNVSLSYTSAVDGINDSTNNNVALTNTSVTVTDSAGASVLSELTLDGNSNTKNGYLDAIQVNFSEGVLDSSFNDADNITVGSISKSSITFSTGDTINDNVVFLNFTGTAYNTGNTPNINFSINANNGTSSMTDLALVEIVTNTSVELSTDTAPPVFWTGYSVDMDKNGAINNINLSLSEALVANSPTAAGFTAYVSYGKDESGGFISRALTVSSASAVVAGNVTVTLNNAVYGTGNISLSYTSGQSTQITDGAGNVMVTNSSITVTDNASAVVFSELTKDTNTNGYLDAIQVNFSEAVLDSSFADNADNITVGSIARSSLTFNTDAVTNDNIIQLYFNGTTTYNTGNIPSVNLSINANNGTSNMTDLAFVNITSNTTDESSTDKAPPVFWTAYSTDEDRNGALDTINISTSEALTAGANVKGVWAATINYGPGTRLPTFLAKSAQAAGNITLELDNTVFGTGAITLSYTQATGGINDSAGNLLITNTTITVTDNASAIVFSERTVDSNTNGYLDAIQVNFSEPVLDSSFADNTDNITVGSLARASLTFSTGDTVNDNLIFLNFTGTTFNTGNTPSVNFSINANNGTSNMTDLAFVNITSNTSVELSTDMAVPVFWWGDSYDADGNGALDYINLTMSETLKEGTLKLGIWSTLNVNYGPGTRNLVVSSTRTNASKAEITLNNAIYGTGAITIAFTAGTDGINDTTGLAAASNTTALSASDNASAVVFSEYTMDANKNGYLDAIMVNFSEPVLDSSFADDTDNITVGSLARASLTFSTGDTVNDNLIFLNFTGTTFNTGNTPNVNFSISANNVTSNMTDLAFKNITSNTTIELSTDTAVPVFWFADAYDADNNGAIDYINITMSEALTEASITGSQWGTPTIKYDSALTRNLAVSSSRGKGSKAEITFSNVATTIGTGAITLGYTALGGPGSIVDVVSNLAASNASVTVPDNLSAVFISALTIDANANGYLDAVQVNFSEGIGNYTFGSGVNAFNGTNNITLGTIFSSSITFDPDNGFAGVNDSVIYLNFTGTTYNTGGQATVNFSSNATTRITDIAGTLITYVVSTSTQNLTTDTASPVILSKNTLSFNRTGYLDTINITFSEPVVDTSCDVGNISIEGISAFNYYNSTYGAFPGDSANDQYVYLGFTGITYFTNGTPMVNYTTSGSSAFKNCTDVVSNKLLQNQSAIGAIDTAPPVLLSAAASDGATATNGVDSDDYILMTFSEPIRFIVDKTISNTTLNSTQEKDAIFYLNATGGAWVGGWDVNVGRFNDSQNRTMNVTFSNANSNLSAPDVYKIFMNISVRDASGSNPVIQDNKTNVSLTGSFQDVQVPTVSTWWTNDSNANGYIDSIVVTMSEAVNNDTGNCGIGWNVTGYNVNTKLSTCNNATLVNLTITELSVFDTNATPLVYYNASVGVIRDITNNNRLADANSTSTDKARPVLLNATTFDGDGDGYIDAYNLTFSENVTDGSFNWTGETVPAFSGANFGFTNVTGTRKNDAFINLNFADGNSSHPSNATPDLTNSFINDTATVQNAMADLTSASFTEYDLAAPQFWVVSGFSGNLINRTGKDGWLLGTKFKVNQNISIKLNASENLTQPTVTVNGNAATFVGTTNTTSSTLGAQTQYEYYYVVQSTDTEGTKTVSIAATDLRGTGSWTGQTTTNTSQNLTFDHNVPMITGVTLVDQPQDDGAGLKLTWTASTADDFLRYSFMCNLTNSSQLATLTPVSTDTTAATALFTVKSYNDGTNTTLTDGTSYYCVINVSDSIGNVNTSINVTSIPYANGNASLTANKWQMIGTPKYLNNTKFSSTGFSTSDSVTYYNGTDATWYTLGVSTDKMYQLRGYWLYNYDGLQVNTTYRATTGGITPETTTLYTGWNLIGSPTNTAGTNVTTKLNNALGSTKWSIIYFWNVSDSTWYYNTPTGEGDLGAFNVDGGYWISMTSAGSNSTVYSGVP